MPRVAMITLFSFDELDEEARSRAAVLFNEVNDVHSSLRDSLNNLGYPSDEVVHDSGQVAFYGDVDLEKLTEKNAEVVRVFGSRTLKSIQETGSTFTLQRQGRFTVLVTSSTTTTDMKITSDIRELRDWLQKNVDETCRKFVENQQGSLTEELIMHLKSLGPVFTNSGKLVSVEDNDVVHGHSGRLDDDTIKRAEVTLDCKETTGGVTFLGKNL